MARRQDISARAVGMRETPDPTPVEVGIPRPPTMQELIAAAVRNQLSNAAASQGFETFEESDDFDVSDDLDDLDFPGRFEVRAMRPEFDDGDDEGPLNEREQAVYDRLKARADAASASSEPSEEVSEDVTKAAG